jgi:hypothetical protein
MKASVETSVETSVEAGVKTRQDKTRRQDKTSVEIKYITSQDISRTWVEYSDHWLVIIR